VAAVSIPRVKRGGNAVGKVGEWEPMYQGRWNGKVSDLWPELSDIMAA